MITLDHDCGSIRQELDRARATFRGRGWTFWHGGATGQYWAAHTGRMVLLSGNNSAELIEGIRKVTGDTAPRLNLAPVVRVPAPRRPSPRSAGDPKNDLRARPRAPRRQTRWIRELTPWPRLRRSG
ncbi:hypothetical protein [Nocardiopsis valliformis]|uniref:hypothetical protein n=1 Tax=Nocardiopsis valliformis TaxID=239974 RepID=UPI0003473534|nr:hypothetical protein [Nocardiopsis valliformis]